MPYVRSASEYPFRTQSEPDRVFRQSYCGGTYKLQQLGFDPTSSVSHELLESANSRPPSASSNSPESGRLECTR